MPSPPASSPPLSPADQFFFASREMVSSRFNILSANSDTLVRLSHAIGHQPLDSARFGGQKVVLDPELLWSQALRRLGTDEKNLLSRLLECLQGAPVDSCTSYPLERKSILIFEGFYQADCQYGENNVLGFVSLSKSNQKLDSSDKKPTVHEVFYIANEEFSHHHVSRNIDSQSIEPLQAMNQAGQKKNLHVFDWDGFAIQEKPAGFQLTVNALFAAGHEYLQSHPHIHQIADRLSTYLTGERYQSGMPILAMGLKKGADYLAANPKIYRSKLPENLMDNLATIAPDIDSQLDIKEKEEIINIFKAAINSQYKDFIRPPISEKLAIRRAKMAAEVNFYYKDIKLEYMPGFEKLMDRVIAEGHDIAVISNKGDWDLEQEINKVGISHKFVFKAGAAFALMNDKVAQKDKKPLSNNLRRALEQLGYYKKIVLWGDQEVDVTQGADIMREENPPSLEGNVVSPYLDFSSNLPDQLEGIPVYYRKTLEE